MMIKIGKYEMTKGPNIQWYFLTAIFVYATAISGNWWWIGGWILCNIILIPVCLWIHKRNEEKKNS